MAGVLATAGYIDKNHFMIPTWVVLAAYTSIGLGTLSGGWRIITRWDRGSPSCSRSTGSRGNRRRGGGVSRDALGVPVSTTHAITGSIVGVGSTRRLSAVRWASRPDRLGLVLTIPAPRRWARAWVLLLRAFGIR